MIKPVFFFGLCLSWSLVSAKAPNIVFVLMDDLGFADIGYNNEAGYIKTPFMDELAKDAGIKVTNYYANPTCTPSRASLMTGRYAVNTGLPFAVLPGSRLGIPPDVPMIPERLRSLNYSTHMVGKYHLGYATWAQTPVGRGFQSHTGFLDLTIDSWTKRMHFSPFSTGAMDWIQAHEDGSFRHFAEPRHATEAITAEAVELMRRHNSEQKDENPLFLYVAYNAPHSPLLPDFVHEEPCRHVPHQWRRDFCSMVVGLDVAVRNISAGIKKFLGEDTVLIVTSDNGATPWDGGMNEPLRGGKYSTFEGGIRVPTFIVDYSKGGAYFGAGGRIYNGMMHISDWYPTLLSIAGMSPSALGDKLDGHDMSLSIKNNSPSPRNSMLIELYSQGEKMHNNLWGVAYRKGKYKLMEGIFEDMNYYHESSVDSLNQTMTENFTWRFWLLSKVVERIFRVGSWMWGNGPFDAFRGGALIGLIHKVGIQAQGNGNTFLFDIEEDPTETTNVADLYPEVIRDLRQDVEHYRKNKPEQGKYWMVLSIKDLMKTNVPGDCSMIPSMEEKNCIFKHPLFKTIEEAENATYVNSVVEYTGALAMEAFSAYIGFVVHCLDIVVAAYFAFLITVGASKSFFL